MRTLRNLLATVLLAAGAFLSAPAQISFAPNPQLPLPPGIHFYMNPGVDYDGRWHLEKGGFTFLCGGQYAKAECSENVVFDRF